MNAIQKATPLPKQVATILRESDSDLRVGDMFFYKEHEVIRVTGFEQREVWANDIPGDKRKKKAWHVQLEEAVDWEVTEWKECDSERLAQFLDDTKNGTYVKITRPIAEILTEAEKMVAGEISPDIYSKNEYEEINDERALIGRGSKESLIAIQKGLELKKESAQLMHKAVTYHMERKRAEMEIIRKKLYGAIEIFKKQVEKIMRVITTIELYLGIDEELHQIMKGEKADIKEPICFRQQVLFIDEEVGAHEDGGLDFRSIETFDEWLTKENHLDIILPEKKGMVVLRPRRKDKEYHDEYKNVFWNVSNHTHTYILIRNGENVYRIYTEKLVIPDRLFPLRAEMSKLAEEFEKTNWESEKEKIEKKMYQYMKRGWLMQGLVDRTDVFHPLPVERLSIFKLHEHDDLVRFIYDDEATLPSGRQSFTDWLQDINSRIDQGSRVLLTGEYGSRYRERYSRGDRAYDTMAERFYLAKNAYDGLKNVPDLPKEGVYEVEKFVSTSSNKYHETDYLKKIEEYKAKGIKHKGEILTGRRFNYPDAKTGSRTVYRITTFEEEEALTIMYKPDAEASAGWDRWDTHERKLRTRFKIYPDDGFVINYDQITLDDINFYLQSRVDRPNYLSMMPLLKKLRKHLIEERDKEVFFVRFVTDRNYKALAPLTRNDIERRVWESIAWWKFKNKWKRRIDKDDAKALRMIEQRILSPNYNKFEKFDDGQTQ